MCIIVYIWSPTTKNVFSLGYRSQKSIHFGAFRSRLHPPPCLIHFEFLVTPPYFIHFQPFVWNEGGLTFIHYVWWGLKESPESCSTKKIDKFQTQSLSYILSCLVGCLGDQLNTIKYCMILMILQYSILHDLEVPNTYNDSLALTHKHP